MKYKARGDFSLNPKKAIDEILIQRGIAEEDLEKFKHPTSECEYDWQLLDNINDGVELLLKHLNKDSKICFCVDADQDGFSSSAILWRYIKDLWPNAQLFFKVQNGKVHGLEHLIEELTKEQYELVICPDSATNDAKYIVQLGMLGSEVLVLDHHLPDENLFIPTNMVLINNQTSANYPNKELCGAGVVYKFCQALDKKLGISHAHKYIDLVALGEIADVMDKRSLETNYYMEYGLRHIQTDTLRELLAAQEFKLKERSKPPYDGLTTIDIAWYISPLTNAITRLGTVVENETMFLSFIDPYKKVASTKRGAKPGDTETAISQTIRIGTNCKSKQGRVKDKAIPDLFQLVEDQELYKNNIIVIPLSKDTYIPNSLRGLFAQNIVSKYRKPTIIGTIDGEYLRGSLRNDKNFAALPDFKAYLESTHLVDSVLGHENSAGVCIKATNIPALIAKSNKDFTEEDFDISYAVDYILPADTEGLRELFYELASCSQYFGNGIDEIKIVVTNINTDNMQVMGADSSSAKIHSNGIDYVKFTDYDFINALINNRDKTLTVYGKPQLNTFNGRTSIQVLIDDYDFSAPKSWFEL